MNLKCMKAISHLSSITSLTIRVHKITDMIRILTVLAAEDMIPDSFHCYQLHLETLVVSEQCYILIREYAITYETSR